MRRLLGPSALLVIALLVLAQALSACGEDTRVVLVHATAGGGRVGDALTPLPDDAALAAFTAGLSDDLAGQVQRAYADLSPGDQQVVVGQVVSIGCDVPAGAAVGGSSFDVDPPREKHQECLAPVTTVALGLTAAQEPE